MKCKKNLKQISQLLYLPKVFILSKLNAIKTSLHPLLLLQVLPR